MVAAVQVDEADARLLHQPRRTRICLGMSPSESDEEREQPWETKHTSTPSKRIASRGNLVRNDNMAMATHQLGDSISSGVT